MLKNPVQKLSTRVEKQLRNQGKKQQFLSGFRGQKTYLRWPLFGG
jgi:hypothetical protein